MSHCCYGDQWCERCQSYMAPERVVVEGHHLWTPGRVGWVLKDATTPWSWASLPGLLSRTGDQAEHFDFQPAIDDEGGAPLGYRWGYFWVWRSARRLFGHRGPTWLTSVRHDSERRPEPKR